MAASFFDRESTVAPPGYNRFLVPPAALAVHLSIGQAYAFSTFNLPLTKLIGLKQSAPDDWELTDVGWTFSIAIAILGLSAAVFGKWVERVGPRKSMFVAALCFGSGFIVSAIGIHYHEIFLLYLGYGVLGGCGLGIGYISPVSTLIKWFPDRPGMATGMAIMGFGGGALDRRALVVDAHGSFQDGHQQRRAGNLRDHGRDLFLVHDDRRDFGSSAVGGLETGRMGSQGKAQGHGDLRQRVRGRVLAHPAVLAALGGPVHERDRGHRRIEPSLTHDSRNIQRARHGGRGGGLRRPLEYFQHGRPLRVGVDVRYLGRRNTYTVFLSSWNLLYLSVPTLGYKGSEPLFVAAFVVIISMYGGGFATIPAYLRDMFGTMNVGAIHGRLLTAWAVAGVLGPVLVNYIRKFQIDHGVPKAQAYSVTMYIMCALLLIGLICNSIHARGQ
jgi:MFS family permease